MNDYIYRRTMCGRWDCKHMMAQLIGGSIHSAGDAVIQIIYRREVCDECVHECQGYALCQYNCHHYGNPDGAAGTTSSTTAVA